MTKKTLYTTYTLLTNYIKKMPPRKRRMRLSPRPIPLTPPAQPTPQPPLVVTPPLDLTALE